MEEIQSCGSDARITSLITTSITDLVRQEVGKIMEDFNMPVCSEAIDKIIAENLDKQVEQQNFIKTYKRQINDCSQYKCIEKSLDPDELVVKNLEKIENRVKKLEDFVVQNLMQRPQLMHEMARRSVEVKVVSQKPIEVKEESEEFIEIGDKSTDGSERQTINKTALLDLEKILKLIKQSPETQDSFQIFHTAADQIKGDLEKFLEEYKKAFPMKLEQKPTTINIVDVHRELSKPLILKSSTNKNVSSTRSVVIKEHSPEIGKFIDVEEIQEIEDTAVTVEITDITDTKDTVDSVETGETLEIVEAGETGDSEEPEEHKLIPKTGVLVKSRRPDTRVNMNSVDEEIKWKLDRILDQIGDFCSRSKGGTASESHRTKLHKPNDVPEVKKTTVVDMPKRKIQSTTLVKPKPETNLNTMSTNFKRDKVRIEKMMHQGRNLSMMYSESPNVREIEVTDVTKPLKDQARVKVSKSLKKSQRSAEAFKIKWTPEYKSWANKGFTEAKKFSKPPPSPTIPKPIEIIPKPTTKKKRHHVTHKSSTTLILETIDEFARATAKPMKIGKSAIDHDETNCVCNKKHHHHHHYRNQHYIPNNFVESPKLKVVHSVHEPKVVRTSPEFIEVYGITN